MLGSAFAQRGQLGSQAQSECTRFEDAFDGLREDAHHVTRAPALSKTSTTARRRPRPSSTG